MLVEQTGTFFDPPNGRDESRLFDLRESCRLGEARCQREAVDPLEAAAAASHRRRPRGGAGKTEIGAKTGHWRP